jgi:hypothetical protein
MLRRIVDIAAVVAVTGILGLVGWHSYTQYEERSEVRRMPGELRRFEQVLALQAASGQTQINTRGWPLTISPEWFGSDPPRNALVSHDRPWLEVASPEQADLADPVVRMTIDRSVAAFWYNPFRGIVRARVPMQISDDRSLALYNAVNGRSLNTIHGTPVEGQATSEPATDDDERPDAPALNEIAAVGEHAPATTSADEPTDDPS